MLRQAEGEPTVVDSACRQESASKPFHLGINSTRGSASVNSGSCDSSG